MTKRTSTPSFSPARRWKIAASVCLSVLSLLAIVVMANYLASRHFKRVQVSSDARLQLSPLTLQVLRSVTNNVKVIVFFDRDRPLYGLVSELLNEYELKCPMLELEYVDYVRSPGRARLIETNYGLASAEEGDRIIFESGGRRKVLYARDLAEFDYGAVLKGKEVKRTAFKGEQLFSAAIYSLIDPRLVKVYFLQGHGERDPEDKDDQRGFSKFARILHESHVAMEQLNATGLLTSEIPADCHLLVIADPITRLPEEELEKIEKYLNQGGRLLVLFSAQSLSEQPTGLERLLANWGVEVGRNFVYDQSQGKAGDLQQVIVTHFGNHPIVRSLGRSRLSLFVPRSIGERKVGGRTADAPKVMELATTSSDGVATRGAGQIERRNAAIPLMVAVEKGAIQGITLDRGATRIVVVGESFFLTNAGIEHEANRDFARSALHWLLSRDVLLEGIGPRPIKEYRITLTAGELSTLRWLFLAGFPGGVLCLGFVVWLRRRA
jgi:hypothetical protein